MMKRYFYSFSILASSLFADIPKENLDSIYKEAAFFVLVGVVMSIVSYKISSRHAKEYAVKNQNKIDAQKEAQKEEVKSKKSRVVELQKMLDDGLINDDEFKFMKKRMYNTEE